MYIPTTGHACHSFKSSKSARSPCIKDRRLFHPYTYIMREKGDEEEKNPLHSHGHIPNSDCNRLAVEMCNTYYPTTRPRNLSSQLPLGRARSTWKLACLFLSTKRRPPLPGQGAPGEERWGGEGEGWEGDANQYDRANLPSNFVSHLTIPVTNLLIYISCLDHERDTSLIIRHVYARDPEKKE